MDKAKNVLASPEKAANAATVADGSNANADSKAVTAGNAPASTGKGFYNSKSATLERVTLAEVSKYEQSSRGGGGSRGVHSFGICCAEGNRKSLKLSKTLYAALYGEIDEDAEPRFLQVQKDGTDLFISEKFADADDDESFQFSNPTSAMVYNIGLVRWVADVFNLDFSKNANGKGRTSRSFQHIKVVTPEKGSTEKPYAIIDMTRQVKK